MTCIWNLEVAVTLLMLDMKVRLKLRDAFIASLYAEWSSKSGLKHINSTGHTERLHYNSTY